MLYTYTACLRDALLSAGTSRVHRSVRMLDPIKSEEAIAEYWKREGITGLVRERNRSGRLFYFLDGPPYVTGDLHPGHIWVKSLKDLFVRYKRYRGFNVMDRAGYDVHGLPIENKVEKELGIASKKEIETRIGVEEFVRRCREYVLKYVGRMDADYERYGISLDFSNPYLPYKKEYMEATWAMFKAASDRNFLYEGKKTLVYCPHCETPLSQGSMEVEYRDDDDPSVFIAFKVDGARSRPKTEIGGEAYLAVWTTTPWTLPANMAVAANPKALYVRVRMRDKELILAKERLEAFSKQLDESSTIISEFYGSELEGVFYINPLEAKVPRQREYRRYHRILFSPEMVSMEEGTGLVHIAPGNGVEDYQLGVKNKIPVFSPLNPDASYNGDAGEYRGLTVPAEANKAVMRDMQAIGALLKSGGIRHSYPHCWRCGSKLIFMATTQWFFNVQRMKKRLLKQNEKTRWHPGEVKGWQRAVLENSPDWTVSRQRYWGIPMPIWRCGSCGKTDVIGSIQELKERAVDKDAVDSLADLHRPYIDRIRLGCECGAEKERIKDILDVWFDSGSAFRASLTAEEFGEFLPTEFIAEYVEQIRGWFQYMLKTSMMVYGKRPFDHIAVHGIMFGTDGKKMSKSLGNFKPLNELTKSGTADAFRLWCLDYNPILNRSLNDSEIKENEKPVTILHNVSNLLSEYQETIGYKPRLKERLSAKRLDEIDAWIVSRVETLAGTVTAGLDDYEAFRATSAIKQFVIEDLSRFYLKFAKKKILYGDRKRAKATIDVANYVLRKTLILSSVAIPFVAEAVYLERYSAQKSIFMEAWPKADKKNINIEQERSMEIAKDAITAILFSREKADLKLRQPLAKATLEVTEDYTYNVLQRLSYLITEYTNIKHLEIRQVEAFSVEVRPAFAKIGPDFKEKAGAVAEALKKADANAMNKEIDKNGYYSLHTQRGPVEIRPEHFTLIKKLQSSDAVSFKHGVAYVDREMSRELLEEACVREFERGIQLIRKEMRLRKSEPIVLHYEGQSSSEAYRMIKENMEKIKKSVNAKEAHEGVAGQSGVKQMELGSESASPIMVAVKRMGQA